ncbi:hypothetical protein NKK52_07110 [Mesorhizobium sp. C277A]|uniref:hypothetical protein n=1 Tax=Mesorhizobium sp. C277A TaxID=2956827 RepID=UPI0003CF93BC|nr:hypothetical protein [Mesorhizobium sp. LSJC277A00]ESW69200.1 hypothetical protein X771_08445 [Mesorhizobium sp. LSJC277A00]
MAKTQTNPGDLGIPSGLSRPEKRMFRQLFQAFFPESSAISAADAMDLEMIVATASRIRSLRRLFAEQVRMSVADEILSGDALGVSRELNSATRLHADLSKKLRLLSRSAA